MKKATDFFDKVNNSDLNIVGRIAFFLTCVAVLLLINGNLHIYKPGTFILIQLFITAILTVIVAGMAFVALAIVCLLMVVIAWTVTGEWNYDILEIVFNGIEKAFKFLWLFIYGDWKRFGK